VEPAPAGRTCTQRAVAASVQPARPAEATATAAMAAPPGATVAGAAVILPTGLACGRKRQRQTSASKMFDVQQQSQCRSCHAACWRDRGSSGGRSGGKSTSEAAYQAADGSAADLPVMLDKIDTAVQFVCDGGRQRMERYIAGRLRTRNGLGLAPAVQLLAQIHLSISAAEAVADVPCAPDKWRPAMKTLVTSQVAHAQTGVRHPL
jgi:hypothetical protein